MEMHQIRSREVGGIVIREAGDGCAAELRAALPRSSLVVIGGGGHIVSTEALEQPKGLLAEFLSLVATT